MIKGAKKAISYVATAVIVISIVGIYAWQRYDRQHVLELFVWDIPGGPCIFIRTPNDKRVLVNGGSNSDVIRHMTEVLPFYSRRIDSIISTDTDGKHASGLIDVTDRYKITEVIVPTVTPNDLGVSTTTDPVYKVFSDTVHDQNVPIKMVEAGVVIDLDEDVSMRVVFPVLASEFQYSKASEPEIAFQVKYANTAILVIGQASTKVQKLIAQSDSIRSDVLIMSHSAIASNVASELILAVKPEYLVHSQALQMSASKKKAAPKKEKPDPLAGILGGKRFNIRETGKVKITSDGKAVGITL